jgi:hypothetical protein
LHSHRGKGYAYALPLLGNAPVQSTDQKNRNQKRLRKARNERRYDAADRQKKFFFYAVYIESVEEEKRRTVRYTPEGNGFLRSAIPLRGE